MKTPNKIVLSIVAVGLMSGFLSAQKSSVQRNRLKNRIAQIKQSTDTLTFGEYAKKAGEDFEAYSKAAEKRFKEYRDSVIADYVKAMKKPWKDEKSKPADPKPIDNSVGPEIIKEEVAPKVEPKTEPKKDVAPKVEPKAEPKKEVAPKVEPKTEPKKEVAPKVEPKTEPKKEVTPKVEPKTEPKKEVAPKVEPKTEPKKEVAPKVEPKTEPKKDVAPKPKPRDNGHKAPVGKIKVKEIVEIPPINVDIKPQPFVPVVIPEETVEPKLFNVTFFGTEMGVSLDDDCKFKLQSNNNYGVANAIQAIAANEKYNIVLKQCLELRDDYSLCDWAYFKALDEICSQFLGKDTNEATLLTGYLFCMSGYRVRYAFDTNGKLYNMLACEQYLVGETYITMNNDNYRRYYIIGAPKSGKATYYVCDYAMPKERSMSLYIADEPKLSNAERDLKLKLHSYPDIAFDYRINKNLIDFYNTYPTPLTEGDNYSKWSYYAMAPMSRAAKETVYPVIKAAISGKSEREAVNIIMNMIETFKYGYDDKIWGYDRAFFPDETLYYPYSDCEDHAILLTRMVRDLLNLPTALIYYPGHLASAVCFSQPEEGDYVVANGNRYTICDATIYYAGVGVTMRGMNNNEAVVILVK